MNALLSAAFYLLIMINPISKVFIVSAFSGESQRAELRRVMWHSSAAAFAMLAVCIVAGQVILTQVFHVEIYSLRVAGGIVLFFIGHKALSKGVFFETDANNRLSDISIVPLACPMIAGPATITASIGLTLESGVGLTLAAAALAVLGNLALMWIAPFISRMMLKYNVMGAMIRITGLIVAAIAVQMVFSGVSSWWLSLPGQPVAVHPIN